MSSNSAPAAAWPAFAAGLLMLLALAATAVADRPALPESLGEWYKPQNERQVWLHTMFAMRRELQAVREYATEGDMAAAARWGERLATHYRSLADKVPAWRDQVDNALIGALEQALADGDAAGIARAADRLDRDCNTCHRDYQALAALRYRWPRFDTLRIGDGAGGTSSYHDHMNALSTTLNRVKIASDDGRWARAAEAMHRLRLQLDALGDSCAQCHRDAAPRERILGAETTATLDRVDAALTAHDGRAAGRALGEAAVQTCARCHGVHRLLSELQQYLFD